MKCLKCLLPLEGSNNTHYGLHPSCFLDWFNVSSPAEFVSLQRRSDASSSSAQAYNPSPQNTSFFHGKFKKYSAYLNGDSYILKMRQEDAPELPEVEYLCNQIGESLGISLAEFYYIDFNGDKTFVTKNFIKSGAPVSLEHIYHFRPNDSHNCEKIIQVITEKTQRPNDVKTFIKTTLFDALIGNNDRHGRNLAFITTAKGALLSPIYDSVSYLSLEKGNMLKADFNPTGKISTRAINDPSMHDYVKEFKRLGYEDEIKEFHQSIKPSEMDTLVDMSFCSNLMKNAIKALIKKRLRELENEICY